MKTEARLQQECFMWFWNEYPELRGMYFQIKNESTSAITGARAKATGVVPGVADSCLLLPNMLGVVFIEFKTVTGAQSAAQKKWEHTITPHGYRYYIVRSLERFQQICMTLIP